jgi:hypothetical protein
MKLFGKKKEEPKDKPTMETGTGPQPDYQRMMRTIQGDAKGHALNKLIVSDASNPIKSSNANPFNLAVMDVMGHWESAESEEDIIRLFLNGRTTVSGEEIEGGYRINKMAEDFKMSLAYIDAYKAWTLLGGSSGGTAPSTIKEGDRK